MGDAIGGGRGHTHCTLRLTSGWIQLFQTNKNVTSVVVGMSASFFEVDIGKWVGANNTATTVSGVAHISKSNKRDD